jgi:hypothetical protein
MNMRAQCLYGPMRHSLGYRCECATTEEGSWRQKKSLVCSVDDAKPCRQICRKYCQKVGQGRKDQSQVLVKEESLVCEVGWIDICVECGRPCMLLWLGPWCSWWYILVVEWLPGVYPWHGSSSLVYGVQLCHGGRQPGLMSNLSGTGKPHFACYISIQYGAYLLV